MVGGITKQNIDYVGAYWKPVKFHGVNLNRPVTRTAFIYVVPFLLGSHIWCKLGQVREKADGRWEWTRWADRIFIEWNAGVKSSQGMCATQLEAMAEVERGRWVTAPPPVPATLPVAIGTLVNCGGAAGRITMYTAENVVVEGVSTGAATWDWNRWKVQNSLPRVRHCRNRGR